jgi:ATP-dependent DNA helicase RecG
VIILNLLKENPEMTIPELSKELNISSRAIEKQIAKLKKDNKIERKGSARSGSWVVK